VPIYLEFADGRVTKVGSMPIAGARTVEQTVPLRKFPAAVKKVLIDYYYDVLSTEN
jgi:hypothetical protein